MRAPICALQGFTHLPPNPLAPIWRVCWPQHCHRFAPGVVAVRVELGARCRARGLVCSVVVRVAVGVAGLVVPHTLAEEAHLVLSPLQHPIAAPRVATAACRTCTVCSAERANGSSTRVVSKAAKRRHPARHVVRDVRSDRQGSRQHMHGYSHWSHVHARLFGDCEGGSFAKFIKS